VRTPHRAQPGFALLELCIAMALATLLAAWAANTLMRQVRDAAAQADGVWLAEIRRALEQMMAQHFEALAAGAAPRDAAGRALYADPLAPRIDELRAGKHLPVAFPERGSLGLRARTRIVRAPACPGDHCRLDAIAYTEAPVWRPGSREPDFTAIAALVMAMGGYGGSVAAAAPQRFRGANFQMPNPPDPAMAPLPPGTVAAWAGYDTAAYHRFLRVQDPRDPDLRGPLSVAGPVHAAGPLAVGGTVQAAGSLTVAGDMAAGGHLAVTGGIRSGGVLSAAGGLSTGGAADIQGDLHAGGALRVDRHLDLAPTAAENQGCARPGLFASDNEGRLLGCRGGAWSADDSGFGGAFVVRYNTCIARSGRVQFDTRSRLCQCPPPYIALEVEDGGERRPHKIYRFICIP
jgi:hypothetical protein